MKSHPLRKSVSALALLVLVLVASPATAQTNLLSNGGFELGDASGWTTWGSSVAADSTVKRTGNFSGRVFNRSLDWQTVVVNALPLVAEGKTYRFSAWVRLSPGADSQVAMWVATTDGSSRRFTIIQAYKTCKAGEWAQLSGEFAYAPIGIATELAVYFQCADATREFYVDDAKLALSENLLPNLDFERGNVDEWAAWGSTISASATEKRSGQFSGYVTGRTANWHGARLNSLHTKLVSGKTYRASVWIKPAAGSDITVQLTTYQANGGNETYGPVLQERVCAPGDWSELSGGFTFVNPGATTEFSLYLFIPDTTRSYYIDDAEVRIDEVSVDLAATGGPPPHTRRPAFCTGFRTRCPRRRITRRSSR